MADGAQKVGAQIGEAAVDGYNAAAPVVADGARKVADGAQKVGAQIGEAAVDGYDAAAPVVADGARKVADGAQQGYNAAAPVVADGARKVADGAKRGGRAAKRGGQKALKGVNKAYSASKPVVVNLAGQAGELAGQAGDVLANVPIPDISFDTEAAQAALYGGVSMGLGAAANAATGCAAFAADILKVEIFRDVSYLSILSDAVPQNVVCNYRWESFLLVPSFFYFLLLNHSISNQHPKQI